MLKNKTKYVWLMAFTLILSISAFSQMGRAHSPKFIDLKFYLPEQVLSVYFTHGVSNVSYHYIETVQFQFFNLSTDFDDSIDGLIASGDLINRSYIQEHHIDEAWLEDEVTFNKSYPEQPIQDHEHQIFHQNYSIAEEYNELYHPAVNLTVTYWTYMRVTAYCSLGGQFTQNSLAGTPWYDIEHSMIEAVVPTLVCAVIILTPLAIWAIIGSRKEKKALREEAAQ